MRRLCCLILIIAIPALVCAAEQKTNPTQQTFFPADYREVDTDPQVGEPIQKYAPDGQTGAQQNFGTQTVHDNQPFATFKADRFEHQWREHGVEVLLWDVKGWFGNDDHKLYLESEGEALLKDGSEVEEAKVELLYTPTLTKFWDLQLGLRHDFRPDPERSFVVLGVQGLAPYWFEVDATAYLSEDGDVSALLETEFELLLTQRLVVIPRLEFGLSLQDVPEYNQWQGFTDMTMGARLLYLIRREFAPYVGVSYSRKLGETGHNLKKAGEDIDDTAVVTGLRLWF